jgi:YD repeat-containing protein
LHGHGHRLRLRKHPPADLDHTAPTGSGLGGRALACDSNGRVASAKDGRGVTTTYRYDSLDRVTSQAYSDGTPPVSYTYDGAGRTTKRLDGSGTTTYGYDGVGQLKVQPVLVLARSALNEAGLS